MIILDVQKNKMLYSGDYYIWLFNEKKEEIVTCVGDKYSPIVRNNKEIIESETKKIKLFYPDGDFIAQNDLHLIVGFKYMYGYIFKHRLLRPKITIIFEEGIDSSNMKRIKKG